MLAIPGLSQPLMIPQSTQERAYHPPEWWEACSTALGNHTRTIMNYKPQLLSSLLEHKVGFAVFRFYDRAPTFSVLYGCWGRDWVAILAILIFCFFRSCNSWLGFWDETSHKFRQAGSGWWLRFCLEHLHRLERCKEKAQGNRKLGKGVTKKTDTRAWINTPRVQPARRRPRQNWRPLNTDHDAGGKPSASSSGTFHSLPTYEVYARLYHMRLSSLQVKKGWVQQYHLIQIESYHSLFIDKENEPQKGKIPCHQSFG